MPRASRKSSQLAPRIGVALAVFLVLVAPGAAKPRALTSAPTIVSMRGHCDTFRVGKRDATEDCNGHMVGVLRENRVLFVFGTAADAGGAMVTFAGAGPRIDVGDGRIVQAVDTLGFTYKEQSDPDVRAVGLCEYTDFYKGVAHVACSAVVDGGKRFEAGFTTDGAKPKKM